MRRIVILGGGFGGLRAAIRLAKQIRHLSLASDCEVVLVDRNAYQTYTPTLYEAATTSKEDANYCDLKQIVTFSLPEIAARYGIRFINKEIKELDLAEGDVHLADGEKLRFDYLLLALGAEVNYFGIPGLKENSLALKTFLDALKIRDRVLELAQSGNKDLKIVIGGGGSTGVELAGEIQGWLAELTEENQSLKTKVTIVEAGPSLMLGFANKVIGKIQKRLARFGTEVIVNHPVEKAAPGKLSLKGGVEVPFDLLIWTGGVKAAGLMGTLPLKTEQKGRVEVLSEMECLPQSPDLKLYGKIYGIGDAVCFYDPKTGRPIPGVARAALAQADIAAYNIISELTGRSDRKRYRPMEYPYVIPVGGKWAVAKLGPLIFWGFWGWILKGLVEINYLRSILPFGKAIRTWLKGLWIFVKNDRLG